MSVTDDYRWLENWDDPKVKAWVAAQNAYTQSYVSKLPQRPAIVEFLEKGRGSKPIVSLPGLPVCRRNPLCDKVRSGEVRRDAGGLHLGGRQGQRTHRGRSQHIGRREGLPASWYRPSPDGRLIGMALSTGGSEDGSLYVFDTTNGKQVGEVVPRVQFGTAGGDMAWNGGRLGLLLHPLSPGQRAAG